MADEPTPPRYVRSRRRRYLPEAEEGALARAIREKRKEALEREALIGRAIEWLWEKWHERPCPYCAEIQWNVGTPLEIQLSPDEVMSPTFPVMCGNCGQTVLVNAVLAGLADEPGEDSE